MTIGHQIAEVRGLSGFRPILDFADLKKPGLIRAKIDHQILGAPNELFCKIAVLQSVFCWEN